MKKNFLVLPFIFICHFCYAAPSTLLSITPAAVDATTITASDENIRNNAVSSWANSHTHTDLIGGSNTQIQFNDSGLFAGTSTLTWNKTLGILSNSTQPNFEVSNTGAIQSNFTVGSNVTVIFGTESFDQGNNFSSNTFTAPVTGKYILNAMLCLTEIDTANANYSLRIITSNQTYSQTLDPRQFAADIAGNYPFIISIIADMDINDTATVAIYQDSGTQQTDVAATPARFSGALLF